MEKPCPSASIRASPNNKKNNKMEKIKTTLAALAALALAAPAAVPFRWEADSSRPAAAQVPAYRGETIELSARLADSGAPVALSPAASAAFYWQTNGMGSAWWTGPASATPAGVVSAVWTPAMDSGAERHTFF